ncbi:hypothetical protein [Actinoplanes sp. NPDC049316]|uniref:hypothetical protein n=1 Tax=Actinoplanes sp. NPDC049316 TaxID=3154727 RepID=UPI00343F22CA
MADTATGDEELRKYLDRAEDFASQARKNATGAIAGSGNSGLVYAQLAIANAMSALAVAIASGRAPES